MFLEKLKLFFKRIVDIIKIVINYILEKKVIFISILVVCLFIFGLIIKFSNNKSSNEIDNNDIENKENNRIIVKISGEVNNTFYGEIEKGYYLFEIINKYCDGFTEYADTNDIDLDLVVNKDFNINISEDGIKKDNIIYIEDISDKNKFIYKYVGRIYDKIIIYKCDYDLSDSDFETITKIKIIDSGIININKCSVNDLKSISGIGPAKAQAIIDYREENGPFQNIEELVENKLISQSTFESIKDFICVR